MEVGLGRKFAQRVREAGSSTILGAGDEGFVNKRAGRRGKEKLISRQWDGSGGCCCSVQYNL